MEQMFPERSDLNPSLLWVDGATWTSLRSWGPTWRLRWRRPRGTPPTSHGSPTASSPPPPRISLAAGRGYILLTWTHTLNMEVDLQSLFGLHVTWCAQLFSLAETPQLPPSSSLWPTSHGSPTVSSHPPPRISLAAGTGYILLTWTHRLNMEVDLQSLFGLHVTWCAQLFSLAETSATPSLPPHLAYQPWKPNCQLTPTAEDIIGGRYRIYIAYMEPRLTDLYHFFSMFYLWRP